MHQHHGGKHCCADGPSYSLTRHGGDARVKRAGGGTAKYLPRDIDLNGYNEERRRMLIDVMVRAQAAALTFAVGTEAIVFKI